MPKCMFQWVFVSVEGRGGNPFILYILTVFFQGWSLWCSCRWTSSYFSCTSVCGLVGGLELRSRGGVAPSQLLIKCTAKDWGSSLAEFDVKGSIFFVSLLWIMKRCVRSYIVKVFSEIGLALIIDLKYDCLLQCLLNLDGSLQSQRAGANRVNPHLKMWGKDEPVVVESIRQNLFVELSPKCV